jgi:hypothetical protein
MPCRIFGTWNFPLLSTRELLRRKGMELSDYNCVICYNLVEESLVQLLLHCLFATGCWNCLNVQVLHESDIYQNLESFKIQQRSPFFMEISIIMCWAIWKARNGQIFNQVQPSLEDVKGTSKTEFARLLWHAKRRYFPLTIELWLNNFV